MIVKGTRRFGPGAEGELVVRSSFERHPPLNTKSANTVQCCHVTSRARALPASEAGSHADSGLLKFVFVFRASSLTLPHSPFHPVSLRIYLVGDIGCFFFLIFHITYNEFFFLM